MSLCHDMQRNIAKHASYKAWSSKETVGAAHNSAIGSYCQGMAPNEIFYDKNHV